VRRRRRRDGWGRWVQTETVADHDRTDSDARVRAADRWGRVCSAGSDTTGDCRVRPSGAEARAIRGEFLFRFPFLLFITCTAALHASPAAAAPVVLVHTPLAHCAAVNFSPPSVVWNIKCKKIINYIDYDKFTRRIFKA
jgi:hypothetical protein